MMAVVLCFCLREFIQRKITKTEEIVKYSILVLYLVSEGSLDQILWILQARLMLISKLVAYRRIFQNSENSTVFKLLRDASYRAGSGRKFS